MMSYHAYFLFVLWKILTRYSRWYNIVFWLLNKAFYRIVILLKFYKNKIKDKVMRMKKDSLLTPINNYHI